MPYLYRSIKKFLQKYGYQILFIFALTYPLITITKPIIEGNFAFWFDPARDLLLATANLHKLTLIGPPSGIPGVFYGAYWIWLLSSAIFINPDPRFVLFMTHTLPYLVLFPLILFGFSKIFPKSVLLIIWLLFIPFTPYAAQIWNPHLAPLLYLAYLYLLTFAPSKPSTMSDRLRFLVIGFVCGLIISFHISFGAAITISTGLFFLLTDWRKEKKSVFLKKIETMIWFGAGVGIALLPFFLFEVRHGFQQTQAIIFTLKRAIIDHSSVVGQQGLKRNQILMVIPDRANTLLHITMTTAKGMYLLLIGYFIFAYQKTRLVLDSREKRLIMILIINTASLLYVYLSSKNPVWDYHFIGVEIILLFTIAFLIKKSLLLRRVLTAWLIVLLGMHMWTFIHSFGAATASTNSLVVKKQVAEIVFTSANHKPFLVYAYSPAIYTFDYDYLFQWLGNKKFHQLPETDITKIKQVYLIIPPTEPAKKQDFINYRTPDKEWRTIKEWKMPEDTVIIERVRK